MVSIIGAALDQHVRCAKERGWGHPVQLPRAADPATPRHPLQACSLPITLIIIFTMTLRFLVECARKLCLVKYCEADLTTPCTAVLETHKCIESSCHCSDIWPPASLSMQSANIACYADQRNMLIYCSKLRCTMLQMLAALVPMCDPPLCAAADPGHVAVLAGRRRPQHCAQQPQPRLHGPAHRRAPDLTWQHLISPDAA